MGAVFHADAAPPKTRREYWTQVLEDTFGPTKLRMEGEVDSGDRLRVGDAGAVHVVEVSISHRQVAERAPRHIRPIDAELFQIDVHMRGRGVFEQNGRQVRLAPGDLSVIDLSRPCRWDYSSARFVAVVFPRALLPLQPDQLTRLSGARIPGDRGLGALIASLAGQLPERLDDCTPADQARLGTALLDLISAGLMAQLGRTHELPRDRRRAALLLRVLAFIEERLGDPELSPASIAAAHYISLRYLYKLFETEHTTVADWIRQRRLERCRRDLLDPALRTEPVHAIGARWGFTNAASFSRAFRAVHGLPPAEYRTLLAASRTAPPGGS